MSGRSTPRRSVVETLHGVEVRDPYRWLEDGDDPAVAAWVVAQNERTRAALDARPERAIWHRRLVELLSLPVVLGVEVRGDRLFLLERRAGDDQSRLVVRSLADPTGPATVVLADPAAAAADSAVAIDWFVPSDDGDLVAYGVSEGGTEASVLHVVRSGDGTHLTDEIPNCRSASVAWEPDGAGFFYTRYPEGDEYHRTVHHHTLGADWSDDPVVWEAHPTPETWASVIVSPDGRWLLLRAMVGWSRTDLHVLDRNSGEWHTLLDGTDATCDLDFAGDSVLVGTTTLDAPRGRVVTIDLRRLPVDPGGWTTVVAERSCVLGAARPAGDRLIVSMSTAGVDAIEVRQLDGSEPVDVDGLGMAAVTGLGVDRRSGAVVAITAGFDSPPAVWAVDEARLVRLHPEAIDEDATDVSVEHLTYESADGTSIGAFVICRRDTTPGPDTSTILNGYGGFAITETPVWSPTIAAWCAAGGQYVIAQLRGGFEHGDAWHQAGRRADKQNVFDDFHAAADWLVESGRTSRERLAIAGGSNGGLLVGAALTQRPDLCRAVWCAVPLLDMIRFPEFLIARLWTDEYGDPAVEEEFHWLWGYSPYHHVEHGRRYPAVLLTTAEGDTRVDPLHARKMAAMLQWAAADQDERPVLLHQEGRAGHGVGKPVGKRADEQADVLTFFSWELGVAP